jgi:hypothetical protein
VGSSAASEEQLRQAGGPGMFGGAGGGFGGGFEGFGDMDAGGIFEALFGGGGGGGGMGGAGVGFGGGVGVGGSGSGSGRRSSVRPNGPIPGKLVCCFCFC